MKKILLSILLIILLAISVTASWAIYTLNKVSKVYDSVEAPKAMPDLSFNKLKSQPFNVLILGVDTGDFGRTDRGRTDSMMVAHVDLANKKFKLVSIERDLLVDIVGYNLQDKLNVAYAYGGIDCALQTTEKLLNVKIPYYVSVDMGGVQQLIAKLGPVTISNDFSFNADGYSFPKGNLTLSPEQALSWARMRYEDPRGDYGRQMRQQQLLQAMLKNLSSFNNISKWNELTDIAANNIKTNLPVESLILHAGQIINQPQITGDQIQGEEAIIDGISYQKVSDDELNRIHEQLKTKGE
jgi:LCP family protein required for cell wall assembly